MGKFKRLESFLLTLSFIQPGNQQEQIPPLHSIPISITALPREDGRKTEEAEHMREGLRNWW